MTDLAPEAQRVLELARLERTPSDEHRAHMQQRIANSLGVVALASVAASTPAAASAAAAATKSVVLAQHALALKVGLIGVCVVTAGIASYPMWSGAKPEQPAMSERGSVAPAESARIAPAAVASPAVLVKHTEPAPVAAQPKLRARARDAKPAGPSTLGTEIELLHAAQAAWRDGSAQHALQLVREHGARFPRTALALERDALQVLALCQLGRQPEASALARRWLKRAGRSPLRASIEQSCAVR
jgi:hypothetical protein